MADSDQSLRNLRYNQISGALEGFGGGSPQWTVLTLTNTDPTQVPVTRLINTTAPLAGGGNLSADRTLSMHVADTTHDGYLSSTDWNTFNGKQAAGSYITALTGDVSAIGPGSSAATISAATVTGKLITGYVSGAGAVSASDSILQAIQKLNGNDALKLPLAGGTLTGTTVFNKAPTYNVSTPAGTGTVTPDGTLGPTYEITVSGALTLNGPSSPVNGQTVKFVIHNDASHSVTLATGAGNFIFGTDITSYTNSVSLTDIIGAMYNTAANRWYVVSVIQGF